MAKVINVNHIKSFYKKNAILILIILIFVFIEVITARINFSKGYDKGCIDMQYKYEIAIEQESALQKASIDTKYTEYDTSAKAIARVLYGVNQYNLTDNAKRAIIEVIQNRVACSYGEFGNTIEEVCNKPNQWQGYNIDGYYLEGDYQLAIEILTSDSMGRVIPEGCLYLTCNNYGVSVRREWEDKNVWTVS